jgi:hypothetical protein
MPSEWAAVDALMREIGAVRTDALGLDARDIGSTVAAQIDAAIADAAAALDAAIGTPNDDEALTDVCEAIVVARERIKGVRLGTQRADEIVALSIEARRRAAHALLKSIRQPPGAIR